MFPLPGLLEEAFSVPCTLLLLELNTLRCFMSRQMDMCLSILSWANVLPHLTQGTRLPWLLPPWNDGSSLKPDEPNPPGLPNSPSDLTAVGAVLENVTLRFFRGPAFA